MTIKSTLLRGAPDKKKGGAAGKKGEASLSLADEAQARRVEAEISYVQVSSTISPSQPFVT